MKLKLLITTLLLLVSVSPMGLSANAGDCKDFIAKVESLRKECSDSIIAERTDISLSGWAEGEKPDETTFVNICCYYSYDNQFEDYSEGISYCSDVVFSQKSNWERFEPFLNCLDQSLRKQILERLVKNLAWEAYLLNYEDDNASKPSKSEFTNYMVSRFPFITKYGLQNNVGELISEWNNSDVN